MTGNIGKPGTGANLLKGLWILCTNPRHSWTNNETFKEAMEKLEFFVVQDIYGDTDSSKDCDDNIYYTPSKKAMSFMHLCII